MSVSVFIITHEEIGRALLNVATMTFGKLPLPTSVVNVERDMIPDDIMPTLQESVDKKLSNGEDLLILTDLFGSTPCNIATQLQHDRVRIVSGLNLPMLVRVMNYATLPLAELAEKAISGGRDGVVNCTQRAYAEDQA
jgi:mannose PTS system EIIA component